ncbi:MAG: phosphate transport system regulatory protein PhoU, partial [Verrucomicrobia bacterium]|nr:phosphate transport system regulatory protein PhoU [Verrucomicrobiota bacterium]
MLERGKHISTSFDSALDSLKNDALMMSSLAERLLERAMQGLLQRDTDLCNAAIADDEEIDILEKQIDQEGVDLMIRYHPVAADIRQVISTMKMSSNLERIADQSVTIARRA